MKTGLSNACDVMVRLGVVAVLAVAFWVGVARADDAGVRSAIEYQDTHALKLSRI